jgi:hypothetical protein
MRRLQQAADAMKRSSGAQPNPQAAREAAEALREAQNLLAGTQQQLASGKVDSLAHEAARLKSEERAQAERIDKMAGQQQNSNPTDLTNTMARMRERDRLAQDRQQLSNDLSKLEKNMRDSARQLAPNQPGAAKQLRDALTEMDNSDLDNHTQRSADWLRRGINPNANGTEAEIAQGLDKLKQQVQQAQQAMNDEKGGQRGSGHEADQADQTAALDAVERLRNQVESMKRARDGNQAGNPQNARAGNSPSGQPNGQQSGQGQWQANQPLSRGGAQAGGNSDSRGGNAQSSSGDVGGARGDTRRGGQVADGTVWGNINTGNNSYGPRGQPSSDDPSANYADTEQTFQQELRELNQLRQMVKGDPQAAKEAEELARQMKNLDPRRFPGNPEIVEQMHREVLSSLDRLELALQRNASAGQESRAGKPSAVPQGYQDSVADYYRQLSKNQ